MSDAFQLDPRLKSDTVPLLALPLSLALLMDDARFPWIILVPHRPHLVEWHDLSDADARQLHDETMLAARALKCATACEKINIGALGNIVRQLHVHIVARNSGDAAWPGPVWGSGARIPNEALTRKGLVSRLAQALREEAQRRAP